MTVRKVGYWHDGVPVADLSVFRSIFMSHELEIIDGNAAMAYAGNVPWHGLGKKVSNDLTPLQMLRPSIS